MKKRDAVAAMSWILLGLGISIWSATFPFGSRKAPGPGVLPFAAGLVLILLGSFVFSRAISRKKEESSPRETFAPLIPSGAAFNRIAFTLGGMILSAVLLDFLGFILSMFCLTLSLIRAIEPKKWGADIFYAFVFTVGSYLLFQVCLNVTLPRGFWGF